MMSSFNSRNAYLWPSDIFKQMAIKFLFKNSDMLIQSTKVSPFQHCIIGDRQGNGLLTCDADETLLLWEQILS